MTNVEVLVAYVDRVLQGKEGNEKLDEQGIQERLDGTFRLFEFVVDKDVYQVNGALRAHGIVVALIKRMCKCLNH